MGPSGNYLLPNGIKHIAFDKPINVCSARNIGTQVSTGEFIAYLDDDDYWYPQKIFIQMEALSQLPTSTILGCRYEIWSPAGKSIYPRELFLNNQSMLNYLFGKANLKPGLRYFQTSGMILSRAAAQEIGWDEGIPRHNDWDFLLRAENLQFSFKQLTEILVVVDQRRKGSISRNSNPELSNAFYNRYRSQMNSGEESTFLLSAVFQSVVNTRNFMSISTYAFRIFGLNRRPKTWITLALRILNIRRFLQFYFKLFGR